MCKEKIKEFLESALEEAEEEVVRLRSALEVYTRNVTKSVPEPVTEAQEIDYIREVTTQMVHSARIGAMATCEGVCSRIPHLFSPEDAQKVVSEVLEDMAKEGVLKYIGNGFYIK